MKKIKIILRIILYTVFAIYCLIVVDIVFMRGVRDYYGVLEYIKNTANFIPFNTVFKYIKAASNGFRTLAIANVGGNLVLFLPMGMALPCVVPRLNRFWKVTLAVLGIIVCVELIQGFCRVGIMDVDDVILNISGAMAGYGIIKIPPVNKLLIKGGLILPSKNKKEEK